MKFNTKEIMQNAWTNAKNAVHFHGGKKVEYFAECLKAEWAFAKMLVVETQTRKESKPKHIATSMKEIAEIKAWFIKKNFDADQAYAINCNDWIEVVSETEKAFKLVVHNADFGNISTWAPKSCCVA